MKKNQRGHLNLLQLQPQLQDLVLPPPQLPQGDFNLADLDPKRHPLQLAQLPQLELRLKRFLLDQDLLTVHVQICSQETGQLVRDSPGASLKANRKSQKQQQLRLQLQKKKLRQKLQMKNFLPLITKAMKPMKIMRLPLKKLKSQQQLKEADSQPCLDQGTETL